ncbi:hypothetical protein BKI52_27795 [marine bacterium AO1-C]|nr:hypothetical protein BKI52_27795 [marine bacterium AO1-C]
MYVIRLVGISVLLLSNISLLLAQQIIQIPEQIANQQNYRGENFFDISKQVSILRDPTQKLTWSQLQQNLKRHKFTTNNTQELPIDHFENCWTTFTLVSPINQVYFLQVPPTFDADCYIVQPNGMVNQQQTGYRLSPSQKSVKGFRKHFFQVSLKAHQPTTIFILFKTQYRAFFNSEIIISLVPTKAYTRSSYLARVNKSNEILQYIWLLLMLYNGLTYLIVRERLYLIYVCYILSWIGFNDATFVFLTSYFAESVLVIFWRISTFFYGICIVLFLQQYLNVHQFLPKFSRFNRKFMWFMAWIPIYTLIDLLLLPSVIAPGSFTKTFYEFVLYVVQVCIALTALAPLVFVIEAIIILRKGYKPAIWYIVGSSILLVSLSIFYLLNYVFSYNHVDVWWGNLLQMGQRLGFTLEMIIFSLGISYRYNRAQKEKQLLLQNQNLLLEQLVQERTKQLEEAKEEITTQRDILVRKNKDILDSISYAQYIQAAFLPPITSLQTFFPKSFVFFRPKEKVSGDFYWFAHLDATSQQIIDKVYGESPEKSLPKQNPKLILAAADCTGHGVAGALMSMVGNDALNKIVREKGIVEADKILNLLNINVRQLVYQNEARFGVGMDISLVVIDPVAQTLQFAGALNSLVVFQHNEMKVIKGDLLNIGGAAHGINRKFRKHTLDISQPTTIYMFSDGYRDQFGGKKGRKFSSQRFYQLLAQIQSLSMTEQLSIVENTIDEWMDKQYDQLDDIMVMGIHLTP